MIFCKRLLQPEKELGTWDQQVGHRGPGVQAALLQGRRKIHNFNSVPTNMSNHFYEERLKRLTLVII